MLRSLRQISKLSRSPSYPYSSFFPTTSRSSLSLKSFFSSEAEDVTKAPRDIMEYDVVTVGAGPAGLAAAIRLKQLAAEKNQEISVCVVEKGAEVGAHTLSGNVFEPHALAELFPNWKELDVPLTTPALHDDFLVLTEKSSFKIPHFLLPPQLHNEGNYIISLSQLVRWLATKAEEVGVEIYSGFAADEVLYNEEGSVIGVATKDVGIAKDGSVKDSFTRGIELHAKQTLFAEGCRGSCSEELMAKFDLRKGKDVQTYGLGIKEVWEVPPEVFKRGQIQHTIGWPLQDSPTSQVFGGSFLYHMDPNLVLIGMVVGLDYENPYLNPYREFQRWKHHPAVAAHLKGGTCIAYGARVLNEGGYHAIPKLTFPGGALIGCSAGFLNAMKIKGTHTAMKSGMLAAEAIFNTATDPSVPNRGVEVKEYESDLMQSWVAKELRQVRNSHAAFKGPLGVMGGMIHAGFTAFITKGHEPWTFHNTKPDSACTKPAAQCSPIEYPKADGVLSFDLLSNLQRSGTSHEGDQPAHLRVKPNLKDVPSDVSITKFAGPEQRFCPAGVYEYSDADASGKRNLIINAQNCVHCKCCSVKTPQEFIKWTVPEGGGGPAYTVM